ncbi:hypothetical protein H5410_030255 [Solanum commersonii]|uniref:Uncharacterized protein n=1 Tax=Solanum commersonii TaxID=4109 RepID=A0A9J5YFL7_SOLCO|nr:hypothetical protein H5410_030255 [Solanum commersonii]
MTNKRRRGHRNCWSFAREGIAIRQMCHALKEKVKFTVKKSNRRVAEQFHEDVLLSPNALKCEKAEG